FVEIQDGIDGLIHISDLSWSKKVNHPNEFTKVGETLDVVVLELDEENRKLSLGHKQLEENPWETFETIFTLDSIHEGTVLKVTEKGAIIALPYGVEGFAPTKHAVKEDGKALKPEETAEFKIIEFNKDSKRIVVSHARIWEEVKAEARAEERTQKQKDVKATSSAVKKVKDSVEKSTLGDLGVLAQLKEQMEGAENKAKKSKKSEEEA
ncbi:MAG TPA: S1 RNA-binding domain-containing protein, partial [Sphingobacteriaceae bacterium]